MIVASLQLFKATNNDKVAEIYTCRQVAACLHCFAIHSPSYFLVPVDFSTKTEAMAQDFYLGNNAWKGKILRDAATAKQQQCVDQKIYGHPCRYFSQF